MKGTTMQTLEEIRHEGLAALRERLGRVGMVRFLQQFETGRGDYATERHEWVDQTTLDDIRRAAGQNGSDQPVP
jgi:hypothetical protein